MSEDYDKWDRLVDCDPLELRDYARMMEWSFRELVAAIQPMLENRDTACVAGVWYSIVRIAPTDTLEWSPNVEDVLLKFRTAQEVLSKLPEDPDDGA